MAEKGGNNPVESPDLDAPEKPGLELAQFAAGCFWGVELAFQRVEGVVKTEVGYSQGKLPDPSYKDVCVGDTNHAEVVRIHFDPVACPYPNLLAVFWARHDPTTLNRQAWLTCFFPSFSSLAFLRFGWLGAGKKLESLIW
ncbi:hypothetical protein COCNU_scaffold002938G000050 [Cocos nucifera]|nr:hypothetical protein [Cocos nucifera]